MPTLTAASTARELRGNFVMLRADALRLLLPQRDVGAALYLDQPPQATEMAGIFEHHGEAGEQAVLALSAQMLPLADYPTDRFLVTPINTSVGEVGFGWNEVAVLIDVNLQVQALPAALVNAQAPLQEFVEIDGQVVFCCDSERLADYALANGA